MTAEEYAEQVKSELKDTWLPHDLPRSHSENENALVHFGCTYAEARVEIQHTLLGVELKVGRRRLLCPDLATARYLSVFARAVVRKWPFPTTLRKISRLADELESSWHRMLLLADHNAAPERSDSIQDSNSWPVDC